MKNNVIRMCYKHPGQALLDCCYCELESKKEEDKMPDFLHFVKNHLNLDHTPCALDVCDYSDVAINYAKLAVKKALQEADKKKPK